MKKTLVSLAAASLIVTGAMAADADKGVDLEVTGQAVVYYETKDTDATGDEGFFNNANSMANVAIQLNIGGDLGNGFTLGSQLTYSGTLGLENNLVDGVKQATGGTANAAINDDLALTQINVSKKIGNTTVKLGRQELPKNLSPFAFSEGWNVYKNTFDAALVVNTDLPDTTLVGAYVGNANSSVNIGSMSDAQVYMLTAQNKSLPMTTLTASYYNNVGADTGTTDSAKIIWIDAKIADKDLPFGLSLGLQGGSISPDTAGVDSGSAFGVKVAAKPIDELLVQVAYSSVDEHQNFANIGGIKTPLYTQMVYNQGAIQNDANTIVVKAVYNAGDIGKFIAQYGMTTDENTNGTSATQDDSTELDLIYKVKSGGVTYWASAMLLDSDLGVKDNKLRVWARLGF